MAHHLKVEIKDVVLVKPSKSTPSDILCVSKLDSRPDFECLFHLVYAYRSTPTHDDPSHVIKQALSKALLYYYPLAGRLMRDDNDGRLRVIVKQQSEDEFGVPFLEATANCDLSSLRYLDGADTEIAKQLVLHHHLPPPISPKSYPPLLFTVTKFQCGGFTIGISLSHVLCDGFGASQFFHAIVELARGRSEPSVKPMWVRERAGGVSIITSNKQKQKQKLPLQKYPTISAAYAVSPLIRPNTVMKQVFVIVENERIRRMRLSLTKESSKRSEMIKFTSFELAAACVWRSRARALQLNSDGKTKMSFLLGLRGSNNLNLVQGGPLPNGYYGNAIVDADVVVTVRELNERPLLEIMKLIKETKEVALTTDYIRNWMEKAVREDYDFELKASGAVTVATDWKYLGFSENMDFGGKEAVNIVPAPYDSFASVAMCIFSPDPNSKAKSGGGTRIFTTLPVAAIPRFEEEIIAAFSLYNSTSKI